MQKLPDKRKVASQEMQNNFLIKEKREVIERYPLFFLFVRKSECILLEGQYKSYIVLNLNIEYNTKTLNLSLESSNIAGEITALQTKYMFGVKSVPYHSSGQICREFTAEEMIHIANKVMEYVVYCITLSNHIKA